MEALYDALEARLAGRPARAVSLPGVVLRESAVLVPLVTRRGLPHLVLTRRPTTLRHHAGQYAFPGGTRDAADATPLHTALRELDEELGVSADAVRVLGLLDEAPTLTGFRIQPFVGVLSPLVPYRPSPEEVDLVLEVPLRELTDPALRRTERRAALGTELDVDFYTWGEHVIWGASARILRMLLGLLEGLPGLEGG